MAKAISSSLAFTIRLRVAMAVPPQMQVPPPTRMEVFSDSFRAFRPTSRAMVKDSRMANALCKGISEQKKQEIHTVFPCFPFFCLTKNLSLPALAYLFRAS